MSQVWQQARRAPHHSDFVALPSPPRITVYIFIYWHIYTHAHISIYTCFHIFIYIRIHIYVYVLYTNSYQTRQQAHRVPHQSDSIRRQRLQEFQPWFLKPVVSTLMTLMTMMIFRSSIWIYLCLYIYVCAYMYIYIYIHLYIYINIYI